VSKKPRGDVSFDNEWFGIVCWVHMQVDTESFEARGVFLMSLIGLASLGGNLKIPISSHL
jgi:hypothetical protein